jgi:hypothetical protein
MVNIICKVYDDPLHKVLHLEPLHGYIQEILSRATWINTAFDAASLRSPLLFIQLFRDFDCKDIKNKPLKDIARLHSLCTLFLRGFSK